MNAPAQFLNAALAAHKAGRLDEAAALYERLLAVQPAHPDALNLSGMLRLQRGDPAGALARIGRAATLHPRVALYRLNFAKAHLALGQEAEAAAALREAAKLAPEDAAVWQQLALVLRRRNDMAGATEAFRRAVRGAPDDLSALNNLAAILLEQARVEEARPAIARALARAPDDAFALGNEGQALLLENRAADAIAPLRRAVARQPGNAMLLNNLGIALQDSWQTDEAIEVLQEALALAPDNATILVSYGNALKKAGRPEEALVQFEQALALRPATAEILTHIGSCQYALMRYDAALAACDEALRLKPDDRRARHNRGLTLLVLGRFAQGWRDYVARDMRAELSDGLRHACDPSAIAGKHLLLWGEQGLGDEIFFLRFAANLRRLGARRIDAVANAKIASILRRIAAFDAVHETIAAAPPADAKIAAGDLPLVLGMAWTSEIPPSLRADPLPARMEELKVRLAALGPPPYIGVTWRGGIAGSLGNLFKLAPLEQIGAALAGLSGTLVVLQRQPQAGEIAALAAAAGRAAHDLTALNEDLEGMFALLALLDEYVCVSNTNVHLRAMAGRACRVLVAAPPDFRWMAEGAESPWFPATPLYRQAADGSWSAALADLRRDLIAAAR